MLFSHLYRGIASVGLCSANLDRWDAFGIYCVVEGALQLVLGALPDFFTEKFQVSMESPSLPVSIELEETGTEMSSEQFPLQSGLKDS